MAERKRARTKAGKFIPDDPNTPENEAWVTTKSNSKKHSQRGVPNIKPCFCVVR